MTILTPSTPASAPRRTPTSSPGIGMVRRARLEFVAADLLRQAHALHIPVPIGDLLRQPPLDLWHVDQINTPLPTTDAYEGRVIMAQIVAQLVSDSVWPQRKTLLGERPFTDPEIDVFAVALLLPTALLATLNAQQLAPARVAQLFQVPHEITLRRLGELGYLSSEDRTDAGNQSTM